MADLRTLHHSFYPFAAAFVQAARSAGFRITVTSALRSRAKQARLYRAFLRGESALPALPPGKSQHERGLAWDMVTEPRTDLKRLGAAWQAWGGIWGGTRDPVHFQARVRS